MKNCTTCKYGYKDERLGIPMCHHPKRFSEDCIDFNMHEEKESEHLADARKMLPNDLEEAAKEDEKIQKAAMLFLMHNGSIIYNLHRENAINEYIKDAFISGAKWQREQDDKELSEKIAAAYQLAFADKETLMMKEAVEGQIYGCDGSHWIETDIDENIKGKYGDKVRVIIVKED